MSSPRVASLIASSTEIVCALGYADLLVARSHECDYPEFVRELPLVTEPKFRTDVTSLEIDRAVKNILRAGLSVYRVDAEKLRALKPDIIVTQDHCEVCAVSTKDLESAVCAYLGPDVHLVSLTPNSLSDIFNDIRKVAVALGSAERADRLIASLQQRMNAVREKAHARGKRARVAFIEWIDPLMAGGNWVPELLEMVNAEDTLGRAGAHSGWIPFDDLLNADPDIIIVAPCGFDVHRTEAEMAPLLNHPRWSELRAVRADRVHLADGNAYFNRPGPRVVESLEMLAEIVHPGVFDSRLRGFHKKVAIR